MLKIETQYINAFGETATATNYFNLSTKETIDLINKYGGDLEKYTKEVVASKDLSKMFDMIDDFVMTSYGQPSEDGTRFEKGEELSKEFKETLIYDQLVLDICSSEEAASNFINNVVYINMPKDNKPKTKKKTTK